MFVLLDFPIFLTLIGIPNMNPCNKNSCIYFLTTPTARGHTHALGEGYRHSVTRAEAASAPSFCAARPT
jgi:hypothetical protein